MPSLRVKPSLHRWAGWIGRGLRTNEYIFNTEYLKVKAERDTNKEGIVDGLNDEYLQDLLLMKPVS